MRTITRAQQLLNHGSFPRHATEKEIGYDSPQSQPSYCRDWIWFASLVNHIQSPIMCCGHCIHAQNTNFNVIVAKIKNHSARKCLKTLTRTTRKHKLPHAPPTTAFASCENVCCWMRMQLVANILVHKIICWRDQYPNSWKTTAAVRDSCKSLIRWRIHRCTMHASEKRLRKACCCACFAQIKTKNTSCSCRECGSKFTNDNSRSQKKMKMHACTDNCNT